MCLALHHHYYKAAPAIYITDDGAFIYRNKYIENEPSDSSDSADDVGEPVAQEAGRWCKQRPWLVESDLLSTLEPESAYSAFNCFQLETLLVFWLA